MTAEDIKITLGLVPHPREGGWYIRTYESAETVHPSTSSASTDLTFRSPAGHDRVCLTRTLAER